MFKYLANCKVPQQGFDVIFTRDDGVKIYVEMKNKHNTMNSSSGKNTYITLQNHILHNPDDICYLVEVIAKRSQNIEWKFTINEKKVSHAQIRRVSIDKFYELVTGVENAFYLVCKQLPVTIEKLIKNDIVDTVEHDTVIDESKAKNPYLLKAMYLLAFETYNGFDKLL